MTATATAPNADEIRPGLVTRVTSGDLGAKLIGTVGVVALLASIIAGAVGDEETWSQFLFSYLVAYMFTLSIALGAMFFTMVQHITRAGWSVVVRRLAENMMATVPVFVVLGIPLAIGYHTLWHHWIDANVTDPTAANYDAVLAHKSGYLNLTFFSVRAVFYFVVWIVLARYFYGKSLKQDETGDPAISLTLARRAAPGILAFALTVSFAAFDWMMSLDPHWFSTIFGVTYFAGAVMAVLATLTLVCLWLRRQGYLGDIVNTEHYHDIGKLMFAFMVFWTYVNFSQYFLIWYGNLPEETLFYQHRKLDSNWGTVFQWLCIGHFLVPFGFLMSRHIKRNRALLALAAVFLLGMHWLDMQFIIMPTHHHDFHPHWLDATTMIGLVAIFLALTLRNTVRAPLVPVRDPRLRESIRFTNI